MARLAPRHHKMMTKELERRFAQVGRDEKTPFAEKIVIAKYFNPYGSATWYATEYDPETKEFFGCADLYGDGGEWGYFSLVELETTGVKVGGYLLPLERDCHFTEKKAGEIKGIKV